MSDGNAKPGWYLAPGGRKRWWDGQAWHDQQTAPAVAQQASAPTGLRQGAVSEQGGVSGIAIGGMILGIIGIVLAVNAYTKSILFLGLADIFGPLVLGGLGVVLAGVSGRRGGGFRKAGLICGAIAFVAGLLLIYLISNR